jgi:uncharacterized membrane protein
MKKQLNEIKRMQKLAGILEETRYIFSNDKVNNILTDNGIDDDYFESMGGKEIESGGNEWMDVISDLTQKDAYNDTLDANDNSKIQQFISKLEEMGIELV